ncbi:MAG: ABC transporter ATP-binding protein [Planctomycetota bacterium]|nr:MAG: ABC transporter ATP-binding protein [Planctomycetota bacterium]
MSDPVLALEALTVRYGRFTALDGVGATFHGGALGLLGPNGAGKSSMLRAILGLVHPAGGRIRVLGQDTATAGPRLRRRLGYMPERDSYIVGISGVSALAHLAEICGLRRGDAMVRAHDVLHFVGLGEERYREVATYSVGMRQRYKLAAALVHDPDVLILDEPTNGLDPQGRVRMLELIAKVVREHGIHLILASHLLPDVERLCNDVWVLDRGELKKADTVANLTAAARGAKRVRLPDGARAAFTAAAQAAGLHVLGDGHDNEVLVSLPDGVVEPRQVFQLGAQAGVPVLGVKAAARSLEDAFLEALEGQP